MSKPRTEAQRQRRNEYMKLYLRRYRAEHPDAVRRWRENYYSHALLRLQQDGSGAGAESDKREGGEHA